MDVIVAVGPKEFRFSASELRSEPELLSSVLERAAAESRAFGDLGPGDPTQCSGCGKLFGRFAAQEAVQDTPLLFVERLSEQWRTAIDAKTSGKHHWEVYPEADAPEARSPRRAAL